MLKAHELSNSPEATKSPLSKWMATAANSGLLRMFAVQMSALESAGLRAIPHRAALKSLQLHLTRSYRETSVAFLFPSSDALT